MNLMSYEFHIVYLRALMSSRINNEKKQEFFFKIGIMRYTNCL
jgi:hypothetical protein